MSTDPIGTAQERELIEKLLRKAANVSFAPSLSLEYKAAVSLQSRIAEVGELREALDDCVASLAAIRATADNPDEWALSAEHFSTVCLESLKVARAALSLRRRV